MINNIKEQANTATKKVKVSVEKNVDILTAKAIELNKTAMEVSNEVIDDVAEKSKLVGATILKVTKNNVERVDFSKGFKGVKENVSKANKLVLATAESVVDAGFENTKKWQTIGEKAVNGSLEIADKQQTIIFDNLGVLKNQLNNSYSRIKTIFSKN